jgi:hypothetical protein
MGRLSKIAIEVGVNEHLRILTEQSERQMTATLLVAADDKSDYQELLTGAYTGGSHPDVLLLNKFKEDVSDAGQLAATKYVYIYSYFSPCFNCKKLWLPIPQSYSGISFKWAFSNYFVASPGATQLFGCYKDRDNARAHMADMIAVGWKMRTYSATIAANQLETITLQEKLV